MKKILTVISIGLLLINCKNDNLPKPKGYLNLEYPLARYEALENNCPYTFGKNIYATIKTNQNCDMTITYPEMNASIFISYKNVNNNIEDLLRDVQSFTYNHTKKAESIIEQPYVNPDKKVYGMLYDVHGNAASATQFYLTDSIKNFISGSVYFNVKPNSDSILPASEYLKNDVRTIIESLTWR